MKKTILLIAIITSVFTAKAQDFEGLLSGGEEHAGKLISSYLQPVFEGTIYNLNNGWYRTAKTHKKLGFDITISASAAEVPTAKQSFLFNSSDYISGDSRVVLKSGAQTATLPTAFGDKTNEELKLVKNNGIETSFDAIDGLLADEEYSDRAPLAMAQIGIGLFKKTDLTLRFVPEVEGKDYNVKLFGIGLKHNILQYFPIVKRLPYLDVSVFGGYTKLESNYFPTGDNLENVNINLEVQSYTAQVLGSIDLKIINFYAGLGYTAGKSSLSYSGQFTLENDNTIPGTPNDNLVNLNDIDASKFDVNSFKTTLGASVNLFFLKIFADYSIQEYNSITAGLALSFR